jgi:hypothetical protein
MRALPLLLVIIALAGCDRLRAQAHSPLKNLEYSTAPCLGDCPVFGVTVASGGAGTFEGALYTAVKGRRAFRISPAAFDAYRKTLEPLRPPQGNRDLTTCEHPWTDNAAAGVIWTFEDGTQQSVSVYFGCRDDYPDAVRIIGAAPAKLPIAAFITGPEPRAHKR